MNNFFSFHFVVISGWINEIIFFSNTEDAKEEKNVQFD